MDKPVYWMGRSKETVQQFNVLAKKQAGYQLYRLQQGMFPSDFKPMKGVGSGAFEIRIHRPHEYRIVYVAKFEEGIYVLHAFEKKSEKTLHREIETAKRAYQEIMDRRRTS